MGYTVIKTGNRPKWLKDPRFHELQVRQGSISLTFYGTEDRMKNPTITRERQLSLLKR